MTPASSRWEQLNTFEMVGQSTSRLSVPVHWRVPRRMGPVPWPNPASETAVAPAQVNFMYGTVHGHQL